MVGSENEVYLEIGSVAKQNKIENSEPQSIREVVEEMYCDIKSLVEFAEKAGIKSKHHHINELVWGVVEYIKSNNIVRSDERAIRTKIPFDYNEAEIIKNRWSLLEIKEVRENELETIVEDSYLTLMYVFELGIVEDILKNEAHLLADARKAVLEELKKEFDELHRDVEEMNSEEANKIFRDFLREFAITMWLYELKRIMLNRNSSVVKKIKLIEAFKNKKVIKIREKLLETIEENKNFLEMLKKGHVRT